WVSRTRPAQPPTTATDSSEDEFTAAGVVPRRSRYEATDHPQIRWPWRTVRRALATMADGAPAAHPVTLAYVTPTTGAPPLRTLGAEAHWLRPRERARSGRSTASRVFHVIEGHGTSAIGDATLTWEAGDTFVAPPWHWTAHDNASTGDPACLFSFNDEPALRALGLYAEESAP
ncbi:MAG TPA: cupin domain-containing protein, partial [Methylomirabilota bacterium]